MNAIKDFNNFKEHMKLYQDAYTRKQAGGFEPEKIMAASRKLTKPELVRGLREMISAEYDAIRMYTQLADSIDDKEAIRVLTDISDEERVHAGEFLKLLKRLAPDEAEMYAKGEKE